MHLLAGAGRPGNAGEGHEAAAPLTHARTGAFTHVLLVLFVVVVPREDNEPNKV